MAGTVALANGATVSVFPGTSSALMLCVLDINYPQTRTSSSFGMLVKFAKNLDQGVLTRARSKETGRTDSASEFDRLLQTGTASWTTKTCGTFGEGNSLAVSTEKAHPSVVVPMDCGVGFKRWLWIRLTACNAENLSLPAAIQLQHVACRELKIARPPDVDKCDSDDEGENDSDFEPDASG